MAHNEQFENIVNDAMTRITEISIEETKKKMDQKEDCLLIDTREDSEWNMKRIPGSIHIGKGVIERDIHKASEDFAKELILYCGGGFRSALAADNLQKMGYTNVKSMATGLRGWVDAGYDLDE